MLFREHAAVVNILDKENLPSNLSPRDGYNHDVVWNEWWSVGLLPICSSLLRDVLRVLGPLQNDGVAETGAIVSKTLSPMEVAPDTSAR